MDTKLKEYMQKHFDFSILKKVGFFPKEMKFNDYEGQAKRVCHRFGIKSIYEYHEIGKGTRYHLSEKIDDPKPLTIPRYQPFVRTMGEEPMEGKVVQFKAGNA